ncbi:MAG: hypothetical protein ACKO8O_18470, partial [Betaproteobacteria bacterium]
MGAFIKVSYDIKLCVKRHSWGMAANLRFGTKNQVAVMLRRLPPFNDHVSPEVDSATQQDDTLLFLKGVGRALFDERKRCGLSQQQVAERMGVELE